MTPSGPSGPNPKVLRRLGNLRDQRAAAVERIELQIAREIVKGRQQALTMTEMARRLRMSRQAVYDLLERAGVELEPTQNPKPSDSETAG